MEYKGYGYQQTTQTKYVFLSTGRKTITKVVLFTPTAYTGFFNLAFGDLMEDGNIDDSKESNNGDIRIVLTTVVQIVTSFLLQNPYYTIFFRGSTEQRMLVYERILRVYYQEFRNEFVISGLVLRGKGYQEILYDNKANENYFAFLIRRKN